MLFFSDELDTMSDKKESENNQEQEIEDDDQEINLLKTRACVYEKLPKVDKLDKPITNSGSKKGTRNSNTTYLKCKLHHKIKNWTTENKQCEECLSFEQDLLPNGKLP